MEVENENHCDFKLLRSLLVRCALDVEVHRVSTHISLHIRTHMHDLVLSTQGFFESYRSVRLQSEGAFTPASHFANGELNTHSLFEY